MPQETKSNIAIYQTENNETEIEVKFQEDTLWLTQAQISTVFNSERSVITKHINNIFNSGELEKKSVCAKFAHTASDGKNYKTNFYNLDAIISVGYRVNSKRGTQFRQWATKRLNEYLVQGYTINEKRLEEKDLEIQYLKSGINILHRTVQNKAENLDEAKELAALLDDFSHGLSLLDDYDHEQLDKKGKSINKAVVIPTEEFVSIIKTMYKDFSSDLFAKEKDKSFESSTMQIYQSFSGKDLYPTLEEKAAMLLYLIVKNHSFVDGNKRIAAACFLYFLKKNNMLYSKDGKTLLSNDTLASLTLFIAESKSDEMETVKQLTVSILNRKVL